MIMRTILISLLLAAPAFAQDEEEKTEEAPETEPKEDEPKPSEAADPAEEPVVTTEETIFVVQDKPYLTKGDFELAPMFAQSVNDSFTSHTGLMVSGLYHLKENVALEVAVGGFAWV